MSTAREYVRVSDLSPAQVAEQMGLSRSVVYRMIDAGEIAAYKIPGGRLRVEPSELQAFRERNRVKPRSAPAYEPKLRQSRAAARFATELRAVRRGEAA